MPPRPTHAADAYAELLSWFALAAQQPIRRIRQFAIDVVAAADTLIVGSPDASVGALGEDGAVAEILAGAVADPAVRSFLEARNAASVARRGELVDAVVRPVIVARENGEVLGVLTYDIVGDACEVLALHCATRWSGIGTRLLEALTVTARERGCRRLWVVTTNDNVDALRFYQRRDFCLTGLRSGAVHESRRTLKPTIPETGSYGIPLRDELELSRTI